MADYRVFEDWMDSLKIKKEFAYLNKKLTPAPVKRLYKLLWYAYEAGWLSGWDDMREDESEIMEIAGDIQAQIEGEEWEDKQAEKEYLKSLERDKEFAKDEL